MPLTQAEDDAGRLLHHLDENGLTDAVLTGRQLQALLKLDDVRARKCIMMLHGSGFLTEIDRAFADGALWAFIYYQMTPQGMIGLNHYSKGESPFKTASVNHHTGDNITTTMGNVTDSAVAIGRHAKASYAAGIDADAFNSKMAELQTALKQLPDAEREDGEHQLEALARAAQQGPEAVERRAGSFYRYIKGLWESASQLETAMFVYKLAAALFVHAGVTFPELPLGL